jgi:hypothetical protein
MKLFFWQKKKLAIYKDIMSEYIIVDNGQSCDDLENYDFIDSLQACESALSWFYNNPDNNFALKPSQGVKDFANPSERPYGCYWYKWTKRLVYPNQQSEKNMKSDNTKRQVCQLSNVPEPAAGPVYTVDSCLNEYLGATSCQTTGDYAGSPQACKTNHKPRSWDNHGNWNCTICEDGYTKNIETGDCEILSDSEYTGNMTEKGLLCQNWSANTPHSHNNKNVGNHNNCANPDNTKRNGILTPWCYTVDPNVRWDYCDPNNPISRMTTQEILAPPIPITVPETVAPTPEVVVSPPTPDVVSPPTPDVVSPEIQPSVLPATRVPYCRIDKGVLQGQDVVVTEYAFMCPVGSTIFCPEGSSLDQFLSNCVSPSGTPPDPLCRPDETKIEFTGECAPGQIIEELCKNNTQCVQNGDDCICSNENDIQSRTCRTKIVEKEEKSGVFDCGQYTLACPGGYTLDNSSKMCILNQ